jgi:hypothetical protein
MQISNTKVIWKEASIPPEVVEHFKILFGIRSDKDSWSFSLKPLSEEQQAEKLNFLLGDYSYMNRSGWGFVQNEDGTFFLAIQFIAKYRNNTNTLTIQVDYHYFNKFGRNQFYTEAGKCLSFIFFLL